VRPAVEDSDDADLRDGIMPPCSIRDPLRVKQTDIISVEEASRRLLSDLMPLESEWVDLERALGRVLAEEVVAGTSLPPFDNSAMDGFAVRASDVRSASVENPVKLDVAGDIPAGSVELSELKATAAMRIMTGARIPRGADAVVPVEKTSISGPMAGRQLPDRVDIMSAVKRGDHIRRQGTDVSNGDRVLAPGTRLRPPHVGMLASLGVPRLRVHCKPTVALFSTGDELVEIDQSLLPGQIRDGNGYALTAAVREAGGTPIRLGIVPDDLDKVVVKLTQAVAAGADIILSSAGVSLGAFDFVRSAVERDGHLNFWRVNIRPGKPLVSGAFRGVPFVGLPGNPVSALVTFEVFVKPMLDRMSGLAATERLRLRATVSEHVRSDGRESYLRGIVTLDERGYRVRLTGSQDSSVLSSLLRANALVVLPAGSKAVEPGEQVDVWLVGDVESGVGIPMREERESRG
jgi:molybdopterin molybdotransferase